MPGSARRQGQAFCTTDPLKLHPENSVVNFTQPQASGGTPATVPALCSHSWGGNQNFVSLLFANQPVGSSGTAYKGSKAHLKPSSEHWELRGTCKPRHYAHLEFLSFHDLRMTILDAPVRQEGHTRKVLGNNDVHGRTSAWPDAEPEQLLNRIYANTGDSDSLKRTSRYHFNIKS